MIKVLIVARIPIIREGLRGVLASEPDFQLGAVTRFESGALIEDILADQPDVVLVDVDVLERDGWVLLRDLREVAPGTASLVISDTPQDRRLANALALGARGYLTRDASPSEMATAIRAAQQGLYVIHPLSASTLIAELSQAEMAIEEDEGGTAAASDRRSESLIEPLSARELEVLRQMARGLSNKQIAAELIITEHTVKFHIRAILGKLGAANRTEAVTLALQKGLVSL